MFQELDQRECPQPTGIPWVAKSPSGWTIARNKSFLTERKELVGAAWKTEKLLALTKRGIVLRDINNLEGKIPANFDGYQHLNKNDLVFCLFDIDETPRTVGLVPDSGMITSAYTRFEVSEKVNPAFLSHFYSALDDRKALKPLYTGLRKSIRVGSFLSVSTPLPPLAEQVAIVKYLAHVHRRIDRAIAAKRKLIVLLDEQVQATTHQAVTRGLDPSASVKASGVPWLGDVPSHWELAPTRAALRLVKTPVGESHVEFTLLSLTLGGIVIRDLEHLKGKFAADQSSYQEVKPGQFVFCLFDVDETPRTIGLSRVGGMITGAYRVFDCPEPKLAEFVELYFLAMDKTKSFRPLYSGLRKTVPVGSLLQSKMLFPPAGEREAIVAAVRKQTFRSEQIKLHASHEIELLLEFRRRLTSDAVTGQVDVREIAATLPELPDDMLTKALPGSCGDEDSIGAQVELVGADE